MITPSQLLTTNSHPAAKRLRTVRLSRVQHQHEDGIIHANDRASSITKQVRRCDI